MCTHFRTETDVAQNLIDDLEEPSIGMILNEKIYGGTGLFSEKNRKLCMQNLTKERKQPPVVILQQLIFDIIFVRCF